MGTLSSWLATSISLSGKSSSRKASPELQQARALLESCAIDLHASIVAAKQSKQPTLQHLAEINSALLSMNQALTTESTCVQNAGGADTDAIDFNERVTSGRTNEVRELQTAIDAYRAREDVRSIVHGTAEDGLLATELRNIETLTSLHPDASLRPAAPNLVSPEPDTGPLVGAPGGAPGGLHSLADLLTQNDATATIESQDFQLKPDAYKQSDTDVLQTVTSIFGCDPDSNTAPLASSDWTQRFIGFGDTQPFLPSKEGGQFEASLLGRSAALLNTVEMSVHSSSSFYSTLLPKNTSDNIHVEWNILTMNTQMVSRAPHEGITRLLTSSKSSRRAKAERRGLALMMSKDFYKTPSGSRDFLMELQGLIRAVQNTINLDIMSELMLAAQDNFAEKQRRKALYGRTEGSAQQAMQDLESYATIQRQENSVERMIATAKERMGRYGATPDSVIVPPGALSYLRNRPEYKPTFSSFGHSLARGHDSVTIMGCQVYEAEYVLVGDVQDRVKRVAIQGDRHCPLVQPTEVGERYESTPPVSSFLKQNHGTEDGPENTHDQYSILHLSGNLSQFDAQPNIVRQSGAYESEERRPLMALYNEDNDRWTELTSADIMIKYTHRFSLSANGTLCMQENRDEGKDDTLAKLAHWASLFWDGACAKCMPGDPTMLTRPDWAIFRNWAVDESNDRSYLPILCSWDVSTAQFSNAKKLINGPSTDIKMSLPKTQMKSAESAYNIYTSFEHGISILYSRYRARAMETEDKLNKQGAAPVQDPITKLVLPFQIMKNVQLATPTMRMCGIEVLEQVTFDYTEEYLPEFYRKVQKLVTTYKIGEIDSETNATPSVLQQRLEAIHIEEVATAMVQCGQQISNVGSRDLELPEFLSKITASTHLYRTNFALAAKLEFQLQALESSMQSPSNSASSFEVLELQKRQRILLNRIASLKHGSKIQSISEQRALAQCAGFKVRSAYRNKVSGLLLSYCVGTLNAKVDNHLLADAVPDVVIERIGEVVSCLRGKSCSDVRRGGAWTHDFKALSIAISVAINQRFGIERELSSEREFATPETHYLAVMAQWCTWDDEDEEKSLADTGPPALQLPKWIDAVKMEHFIPENRGLESDLLFYVGELSRLKKLHSGPSIWGLVATNFLHVCKLVNAGDTGAIQQQRDFERRVIGNYAASPTFKKLDAFTQDDVPYYTFLRSVSVGRFEDTTTDVSNSAPLGFPGGLAVLNVKPVMVRPCIRHLMGATIVMASGASTGGTLYGGAESDMQLSEVGEHIIGNLTYYSKAYVKDSRRVCSFNTSFSCGYVDGNAMDPLRVDTDGAAGRGDNLEESALMGSLTCTVEPMNYDRRNTQYGRGSAATLPYDLSGITSNVLYHSSFDSPISEDIQSPWHPTGPFEYMRFKGWLTLGSRSFYRGMGITKTEIDKFKNKPTAGTDTAANLEALGQLKSSDTTGYTNQVEWYWGQRDSSLVLGARNSALYGGTYVSYSGSGVKTVKAGSGHWKTCVGPRMAAARSGLFLERLDTATRHAGGRSLTPQMGDFTSSNRIGAYGGDPYQ